MRKKHCDLIIEELEEIINDIKTKEVKLVESDEKDIMMPKVKSFLEHCRSILEYCAQDTFEKVLSPEEREKKSKSRNNKVYFPYGHRRDIFERNIHNNFPGLRSDNSVYKLIEKMQDYNRPYDKKFLSYMCDITNQNKHDKLSTHDRSSSTTINIGDFISATNTNIIIKDSYFDGIPSGDFKIKSDGTLEGDINPLLRSQLTVVKEGYLVFKDSNKKVIDFLELCLKEIRFFYTQFYKLINKYI
ncbi:hypothetical protein Pryu01_01220 [Paraliobacillus ryukyuensis]|uniref:Uncharacterized protein n=1 Tax=Paraliobacillus ryukyuensis TaxID=200904 RepID=A0A366DNT8_9BACI|nr:hypothetical protein [Paraliobacillus ryukyuensis]RBO91119.1 hypothetical protein DES48_1226 [Paraliobacillus ryukyuensis]